MSKSMHRRLGYFQNVDAVACALSDCYSDHAHANKANPLSELLFSEILVPVPIARRGALIAELTARFVCPAFDLPAAAIAADLWARHKSLPPALHYDSRQLLRSDVLILASAKAAGATDFYTNDHKCRALCSLAGMTTARLLLS